MSVRPVITIGFISSLACGRHAPFSAFANTPAHCSQKYKEMFSAIKIKIFSFFSFSINARGSDSYHSRSFVSRYINTGDNKH